MTFNYLRPVLFGSTQASGSQTMLTVSRIKTLPDDIEVLSAPANLEGLRFVARLVDEFRSGSNTFSEPGEALFEVRVSGELVAIGGLNVDPYTSSRAVGRVRRTYVHPEHRSRGIGAALIEAIEKHAHGKFDLLRLRTESEAASRFYVRVGFSLVSGDPEVSHVKCLRHP
ncbi:Acetyltransferase (GNAT) domain-containing protein [Dyella sp. OK004]|uniref:GNAT family N-acetyltransferase n=1 Tax=Dyella sp. OK004 TaxID=1855292 RepID=UPI0008F42A06|nr:GNAT family N-acetyltransferase [Dyella sp. OK004]SFS11818.1 Acetyltransferase (GNAT) domain-containing protein [Dyella sp. OK004]